MMRVFLFMKMDAREVYQRVFEEGRISIGEYIDPLKRVRGAL